MQVIDNKILYKNENWKDVVNYEGLYKVSDLGRVKGLDRKVRNKNGFRFIKEKICKLQKSGRYLQIGLSKKVTKSHRVHKLVAMAFLNHNPNNFEIVIDHINNNPLDNRLKNIQLISNRENSSKDKKNGTSKYVGVYKHKKSGKYISRILIKGKRKYIGSFNNEYDAYLAYKEELNKLN